MQNLCFRLGKRWITTTLIPIVVSFLAFASFNSHAEDFSIEGKYETLSTAQPTSDPDKIEVVEVFWYGCPHCNSFQPYLDPWVADVPEDVTFVRMPAIFRPDWEPHARAYYASNALNALDKTHTKLFEAIHKSGKQLNSKKALKAFFDEQGVTAEDFEKYYDSFGVDSDVRRSKVMVARYGVRGVPAVIVNGKYRISGTIAGSYPNMVKVIDALVEIERAAMAKKTN